MGTDKRRVWEPHFPDPGAALPNGLLASGGDLEPRTLLAAYRKGIFPWFGAHQPILWWSPDPRCVLFPFDFHISQRSLRKIRNSGFSFTLDRAFPAVIHACAQPRKNDISTWLIPEMQVAYTRLRLLGYAHSVEIWRGSSLVGGIYGIALGTTFFGESMFRRVSEASRAALLCLMRLLRMLEFGMLDCQQATPHMLDMGAKEISRARFLFRIRRGLQSRWPLPEQDDWRKYEGLLGEVGGIYPREASPEKPMKEA